MARKKAAATPSVPPLRYEEQQALVVGKFFDGDGWDSIYRTWKERMEDFAMIERPFAFGTGFDRTTSRNRFVLGFP
jgi:hypothetical protein